MKLLNFSNMQVVCVKSERLWSWAGLLPHRRRKNKQLLEELTREASPLYDSPKAEDIVFRGELYSQHINQLCRH